MRPSVSILPAVMLCVAGCDRPAPDAADSPNPNTLAADAVATVNGEPIPDSVFRLFTLNTLQADVADLTDEGRQAIIERLVYLTLLSQEAERTGLDQETEIAAELELARIESLARHMTARFAAENPPSEAELRDLYQENLERFLNVQAKTRHILVATEEQARSLIRELDNGGDFAELARLHSTDESNAAEGGDLGWISPRRMVEPFALAVESAVVGKHMPDPVQTQYGWHVILVEERNERSAPGLDAVRQDLIVEAREQKLQEFVESLLSAAAISTEALGYDPTQ